MIPRAIPKQMSETLDVISIDIDIESFEHCDTKVNDLSTRARMNELNRRIDYCTN